MTNTEALGKYIEKSGFKLYYIAERLKITRESLTRKINNKSEFKASEILALSDLLGIESAEEQRRVFFMPNKLI